ncbi:conserved hypothetical protein [delta proteobacterium NaphS2]|nr:conserved hypothetical protein [delta proteobacterium NaphS2]
MQEIENQKTTSKSPASDFNAKLQAMLAMEGRNVKDLVSVCVELLRAKNTLEEKREDAYRRIVSHIESVLPGRQIDDGAFCGDKRRLRQLNAAIQAVSDRIEDIKSRGREARSAEAHAIRMEALEVEKDLLQERMAVLREKLIPIEAEWLVLAESLSDGALPLGSHERHLLQMEIDRRRAEMNPDETIIGRLKDVRRRLDAIKDDSYPTFDQLVDRAASKAPAVSGYFE